MTSIALTDARESMSTRLVFSLGGIVLGAWAPLVPVAKMRLGIEEGTLGLLLLCMGVGSILAMPMTAFLTSRFGCRQVISMSGAGLVLILPLLATVDAVWLMALTLVGFGVVMGCTSVAMNLQAVLVERKAQRALMSGFHAMFSLGGILGSGAMAILLAQGASPLGAAVVVSVVMAGLLLAARPGLLPFSDDGGSKPPAFVVPQGIVLAIGGLSLLAMLAEGGVLDWGALFMIEAHRADLGLAGFAYTAFAVTMTIGRLTGDTIVKTLGGMKVVVGGGLLAAAGFLLAVFAPIEPLAFAGFLLVGIGASNIVPVLFTAAGNQSRMPASLAIAAITTLGYAGILAGPAAIGFVAQHWTLSVAFVMVAGGLVFVALSWPFTARQ